MADCEFCGPYGDLGCPMCMDGLTGAVAGDGDRLADAAREAAAERGSTMVELFCARCPDRKRRPLGWVRRSSLGPVYEGRLKSAVDHGPDSDSVLNARLAAARSAEVRVPFVGSVGLSVVLLDDEREQEPPEAECPVHGRVTVDTAALVAGARRHEAQEIERQDAAPPVSVLIHRAPD